MNLDDGDVPTANILTCDAEHDDGADADDKAARDFAEFDERRQKRGRSEEQERDDDQRLIVFVAAAGHRPEHTYLISDHAGSRSPPASASPPSSL